MGGPASRDLSLKAFRYEPPPLTEPITDIVGEPAFRGQDERLLRPIVRAHRARGEEMSGGQSLPSNKKRHF